MRRDAGELLAVRWSLRFKAACVPQTGAAP